MIRSRPRAPTRAMHENWHNSRTEHIDVILAVGFRFTPRNDLSWLFFFGRNFVPMLKSQVDLFEGSWCTSKDIEEPFAFGNVRYAKRECPHVPSSNGRDVGRCSANATYHRPPKRTNFFGCALCTFRLSSKLYYRALVVKAKDVPCPALGLLGVCGPPFFTARTILFAGGGWGCSSTTRDIVLLPKFGIKY
eukprot:scaffold1918_cov154-Amphora_coffeaeformis.AAC.12